MSGCSVHRLESNSVTESMLARNSKNFATARFALASSSPSEPEHDGMPCQLERCCPSRRPRLRHLFGLHRAQHARGLANHYRLLEQHGVAAVGADGAGNGRNSRRKVRIIAADALRLETGLPAALRGPRLRRPFLRYEAVV
jgi:hypothetical protein